VAGEEFADDGAEFLGLCQAAGVASSNSPAMTSVGAVIWGSRSMMVHPRSVPRT
jgi:hypothetical protein